MPPVSTIMKALLYFALVFCALSPTVRAEDASTALFFEKKEPKALTTLSLFIEGDQVFGNHHWQPEEMDGAHGTIEGTLKGNIVHVVYSYTIEGSEQSEEQLYKLEGDKLIKGEGEMKDPKEDGHAVFRNLKAVRFTGTVLKKVAVREPERGSPERKAIMDAMRGPVSKHIGKPVQFTGSLRVCKGWARFSGKADTLDGKPPANDDAAGELELDFNAYLRQTEDGAWKPVHWGFAGDVSVVEEAKEKCEGAPWVIFE